MHAWHRGNELAVQLANEDVSSQTIEDCYTRIPKSAVWSELNEKSVKQWQNGWESSSTGVMTKSFFPKISDRLKLRIKGNSQLYYNNNWTWQYQNILVHVQNNREPNVLMR